MNGQSEKRLETQFMSSIFLDGLGKSRLYPLTDRELSGLSHAEQVSQLGENGVTLVQLREKTLSPLEFFTEAKAALHIAHEYGMKIIINDRVDIAMALKADGVHLGQEDLPPEAARHLLGADVIIGFSTHNPEQARRAAKLGVDYIAIGPIFATETKQASHTPVGLLGLPLVREAVGETPLVAIGGITSLNCQEVLDAGADAVAIIKDLWCPPGHVAAQIRRLAPYR
jgi:thiamine-phosphate pyrophosphorylase